MLRAFDRVGRRLAALAAVTALVCAWDLARPPERQLASRVLVAGITVHRATTAGWLAGLGIECRFTPSCSRYAEQLLLAEGTVRGGWRTMGRLLRCGPWTPPGSVDAPSQKQ
jgi:putative component of membrane protein insertase Oxa1/YidC/SpoIIIJ protein YidD